MENKVSFFDKLCAISLCPFLLEFINVAGVIFCITFNIFQQDPLQLFDTLSFICRKA